MNIHRTTALNVTEDDFAEAEAIARGEVVTVAVEDLAALRRAIALALAARPAFEVRAALSEQLQVVDRHVLAALCTRGSYERARAKHDSNPKAMAVLPALMNRLVAAIDRPESGIPTPDEMEGLRARLLAETTAS